MVNLSLNELECYKILLGRNFDIRKAKAEDFERIAGLEAASYDEADAAKPETIKFRLSEARDFFYVLVDKSHGEGGIIVGFINGTCSSDDNLTGNAMTSHDKGMFQVSSNVEIL